MAQYTKLTDKRAANDLIKSMGAGGWTRRLEHMGKGTGFHRTWETFSKDGKPVIEVRMGTAEDGVFQIA